MRCSPLPPAAFTSTPPWAAVGTPSGSWRPPTPTAASSASTPTRRPIARVEARLRPRYGDRLVLRQANFRDLATVAPEAGFGAVDGCLFDLGLSSFQLADRDRGFGFRAGGPLDMRFDPSRGVPASELLASLDTAELTALFRRYGEEPKAPRIARAIVDARRVAPITTAEELATLVERVAAAQPAHPAPDPSRDPRRSRPCGSPSTRSSRRSRPAWPPPSTSSVPAAGSSS